MSSTEAYPFSFRKASTPEFTGGNSVRAPRLANKSILPARSTMRLNWLKSSRFAKITHHFTGESVVTVGRKVVVTACENSTLSY